MLQRDTLQNNTKLSCYSEHKGNSMNHNLNKTLTLNKTLKATQQRRRGVCAASFGSVPSDLDWSSVTKPCTLGQPNAQIAVRHPASRPDLLKEKRQKKQTVESCRQRISSSGQHRTKGNMSGVSIQLFPFCLIKCGSTHQWSCWRNKSYAKNAQLLCSTLRYGHKREAQNHYYLSFSIQDDLMAFRLKWHHIIAVHTATPSVA